MLVKSGYIASKLEFTPLEFETWIAQTKHFIAKLLEFTPLEFETNSKRPK